MASRESSRLQSFVNNRNAVPIDAGQIDALDGKGEYDDLKLTTTAKSNSRQSRSKPQSGNHKSVTGPREPSSHKAARRDSGEQRHIWETDASSLNSTSTATDAQRNKTRANNARDMDPYVNEQVERRSISNLDVETASDASDDNHDEHLPDDPLGRSIQSGQFGQTLTNSLHAKMNMTDRQIAAKSNGTTLPRIKGDSYPSTTSGHVSNVDMNDMGNGDIPNLHHKRQNAAQATLKQRDGYHRQQLVQEQTRAEAHQQRRPNQQHEKFVDAAPFTRPELKDPEAVEQQINSNFSFSKAPRQNVPLRPPIQPPQQDSDSKSANASNTSVPVTDEDFHHNAQKQYRPAVVTARTGQPHIPNRANNGPSPIPANHSTAELSPKYEHAADTDEQLQREVQVSAYAQQQSTEPPVKLDYDVSALLEMDYRQLKDQPFDVDPNTTAISFLNEQQNESLESKLFTIAALQTKDQSDFFTSLPLDEWEQAGDWFLGRFNEVVGKLKTGRQEKRKAAKVFEDEIERRHKAVGRKRKQIESCMSDMKESGGKVLENTPKKSKTK